MKAIIDTDPGNDDAIGLMLAIASPEIDLLGVSTVAGNVPVETTSRNARMICELATSKPIPVFNGEAEPLRNPLVTAEEVHGRTGLEGIEIVEPRYPAQDRHAVDWIIETVLSNRGEVSICVMGPMTNIARAIEREPGLPKALERIVVMGGSKFQGGNVTPMAEYNFYADPHAADIVFRSGSPIVLASLDATFQARMDKDWIDRFSDLGALGQAASKLMNVSYRFNHARYGGKFVPLHDPFTVAYLIRPKFFETKPVWVEIETESPLCRGASSIDWWQVTDKEPNCHAIFKVDADGYFDLIYSRIRRLAEGRGG